MKNLFVILAVLAVAQVGSAVDTDKGAYYVTKIEQSGNFMPPVVDLTLTTNISFLASSYGCTTAKDFKVTVAQKKDGQFVTINRIKADSCEGVEHTVTIVVKTTDLLQSTVVWDAKGKKSIENPIYIANPVPVIDRTSH